MSIVISTFSAVGAEGVTLLVTFFCLKMQLLWKLPHSKQFCQLPSCTTLGRGRGQGRGQLQPERSHQRGGLLLASLPTSLPEKRKQMLKYLFLTSSFKKILCRNSIFLRSVSNCGHSRHLAGHLLIDGGLSIKPENGQEDFRDLFEEQSYSGVGPQLEDYLKSHQDLRLIPVSPIHLRNL